MLKEHDTFFRQLMTLADLLIISAAFFLSYFIRHNFVFVNADEVLRIYPIETYLGQIPLLLGISGPMLYACGAYDVIRGKSPLLLIQNLTKAMLCSVILFACSAYLLKLHFLSRSFIIMTFFTAWMLLSMERYLLHAFLQTIRKKGYNLRNVLVVGTGPRARTFIHVLEKHAELGLKIIGLVDDDPDLVGKMVAGQKIIGTIEEIPKIFEQQIVDEVIFIVPRSWLPRMEEVLLYCEQLGKRVSVAVDLFSMKFAKLKQSGTEEFPLMTFQTTSDKFWHLVLKRFLDIVIASLAILILSPILLVLMLLVRCTSKGPIFFKQVRCGLNGRTFMLYKFRTMVPDAEKLLESLRAKNEMTGPAFKMTHDPRITPIGHWMRKFSLDELPQLMHIVTGEMSIVGPRPPIPDEVKKYQPWQLRRLSMRPGLTCIWQIKGRNKIVSFNEWMKLDLQYIDSWSLWLDLKIFFGTIPVVVFGIGAK